MSWRHTYHRELCTVAQTGKLLHCVLSFRKQARELPDRRWYWIRKMRRADGLFVEMVGLEHAAIDLRNLSS